MKTLNLTEIKSIADDIFGRYPNAKKVSVTSDGMAFITDENDLAVKNHANKNRYGKVLEITEFTREPGSTEIPSAGTDTAAALIAKISAATTVEDVEAIKATEAAGKNRVSVISAAEKKITELNTPAS